MSDISSIGHGPGNMGSTNRLGTIPAPADIRSHASTQAATTSPSSDRVELSQHARLLDQLRQLPDVRTERVEAARQAIESGAYETPEKINGAIELLLDDLGLE